MVLGRPRQHPRWKGALKRSRANRKRPSAVCQDSRTWPMPRVASASACSDQGFFQHWQSVPTKYVCWFWRCLVSRNSLGSSGRTIFRSSDGRLFVGSAPVVARRPASAPAREPSTVAAAVAVEQAAVEQAEALLPSDAPAGTVGFAPVSHPSSHTFLVKVHLR
jgi:hypothetical protein